MKECPNDLYIDESIRVCLTACNYDKPYYDVGSKICQATCEKYIENTYECTSSCKSGLVDKISGMYICVTSCDGRPIILDENSNMQ